MTRRMVPADMRAVVGKWETGEFRMACERGCPHVWTVQVWAQRGDTEAQVALLPVCDGEAVGGLIVTASAARELLGDLDEALRALGVGRGVAG